MENTSLRERMALLISILLGAISQPLLSYSYILLSDILKLRTDENYYKIFIFIFISLVGTSLYHFISDYIKNNIGLRITKIIFNNILYQDLENILAKDSSEYYNTILKKVDIWREYYIGSYVQIFQSIIQIFFMTLILIYINYTIALFVVIFLIPLIINNFFFPKVLEEKYNEYFDKDTEKLSMMTDFIEGIVVIKNGLSENRFESRMIKKMNETNHKLQKITFWENLSGSIANFGVMLSQITGVLLSVMSLYKNYIEIGEFVALLQITFFLNEPVIILINNVIRLKSITYLKKDMSVKRIGIDDNNKILDFSEFDNIKIRDLNYKYDNSDKNVFNKNVSFNIENNKKYLIVGESGSGKSTLIKVLMKINLKYTGELFIGNMNYSELTSKDLFKIISYIPQDLYIFNDTIINNITLYQDIADNEIKKVIELVNLTKFVNERGGLLGHIDKTNQQISGGEKARLCIARALISKKKIIIADEILSNLDKENSLLVENLLLSLKDRTVVHVAHKSNEELNELYDEIIFM